MINVSGNLWIPSTGYKYLTDGATWTDSIYLGKGQSISNWHDTNEEPPNPETEIDNNELVNILLGGEEQ